MTVNNVPPTIALSGDPTVNEGAEYTLTLGDVTDPGMDTVTDYIVHWGDGDSDTYHTTGDVIHTYDNGPDSHTITVDLVDEDGTHAGAGELAVGVVNVPPTVEDATFELVENSPNGTVVGEVEATDPVDALTYSIPNGTPFAIHPTDGVITVAESSELDYESTSSFTLLVTVDDGDTTRTATVTINLLNQPSITGMVFVDADEDGLYDANELGIDGVVIELLDENGVPILDESNNPVTATTNGGGFYLFEDLAIGTYQLHEVQPSGVADGPEILGSLGGLIWPDVPNDTMQLTVERVDATDYLFAEIGQQVSSGDTASIGFWQNKHGQALINSNDGLGDWLTGRFGNIFGEDTFAETTVADFYKQQLFKQKGKKVAGPAKVDAQFMAVAMAAFFTSRDLAGGDYAAAYGFNVTDTGIGTRIVNVGSSGDAFGADNDSYLTIFELLDETNALTGASVSNGYSWIYDSNGDGIIDDDEKALRGMANSVFSMINEQGD